MIYILEMKPLFDISTETTSSFVLFLIYIKKKKKKKKLFGIWKQTVLKKTHAGGLDWVSSVVKKKHVK